jgi:DNA modification methylase/predicted RNA-binding Zn-ribbon protein involved in translation (DUF1610 family)
MNDMDRDIILHGDVYACLNRLSDNSVSVAVTSPPYWKQRDYKFKDQIGQEKTPEEYIGRLLKIFNLLYRKLKEDGIFFLNIGDKYLNRYGDSHLLQIPYRLAYHMVKDGWHLEDIIIWYKPNHMPSSVKNRFTNTYEPILVFAKSTNNVYKRKYPKVVEIPLQQTPWEHTAVYPEKLVLELLERVELKDKDIVLDPFAGTGTTAVVVNKKLKDKFHIESIMIEKSNEFVEIIKKRTNIEEVLKVEDVNYDYEPVVDDDFPEDIHPNPVLNDKYGEVYTAEDYREFLSVLRGITTEEFKKFHREDALYFFGVKNWSLDSLYYSNTIYKHGYILRNMLVISNGTNWYPIFMFVRDSKKVAYKFYLDRIRVKAKTEERREWKEEELIGMKVRDISGKKSSEGYIVKVLKKYDDGFPKIVVVQWNEKVSIEFVIHPEKDEFLMEGIRFLCPKCGSELIEPYDPVGDNQCQSCGQKLWINLKTVPIFQEPEEIYEIEELESNKYFVNTFTVNEGMGKSKTTSNSKFISLERINWGASPGARKLMLGEYFTKMRLYRIDQPIVAQYLTLLRKSKNISIQDIISKLPKEYHHTVGHWFRKDFGGSIPVPEDIELLNDILGDDRRLLAILKRTTLKFQTIKQSIKGKNPGDYIKNDRDLLKFLKMLYIPSSHAFSTPKISLTPLNTVSILINSAE